MMHASSMKSVAAACLACAFAAQAAPVTVPVSGMSTWTLSNGGWTESQDYSELGGFVAAVDAYKAKVVVTGEASGHATECGHLADPSHRHAGTQPGGIGEP